MLLPCFVAAREKFLVIGREGFFIAAKLRVPFIRDLGEMRISGDTKRLYGARQGIPKIFVVAFAEAIALHDDVAAKVNFL